MADIKISELSAITSPDGSEELVVNDGGTTKKITITAAMAAKLPLTGGTMTGRLRVLNVRETVFAVTGALPGLAPENGTLQTWDLPNTAAPTFGSAWISGESITLMITDGAGHTITWPATEWAGGSAPEIATSGYTVIVLWKVGTTFYGQHAGDMS